MSKGTSSPKAVRNYRFRIYPNREQEQKLLAWLETCRWIYNFYPVEKGKGTHYWNGKMIVPKERG